MFRKLEDFLPSTGNFIRNIANDVVRECARQNVVIDNHVASLAVGLLSLDPRQGLPITAHFDLNGLDRFVKECASKFLDVTRPSVLTLQLQVFFMKSSLEPEVIEKHYREKLAIRLNELVNDILTMQPHNKEEQDKLIKKMAVDVILNNHLGTPTNHKILTETINALKSVMSRTDLVNFIATPKHGRMETLNSIRQIVCGIRVFNKDAGHCGEGVADIISDVSIQFKVTKQSLHEALDEVLKQVHMLSQTIRNLYEVDTENHQLQYMFPENFDLEDFMFLNELLLLNYQHEKFIRTLMRSLSQLKKSIDGKFDRFKGILKILHEIVQYRTAVPTEKVFPHFRKLSIVWKSLLEIINQMKEINIINEKMAKIAVVDRPYEELVESVLRDSSRDASETAEPNGGKLQITNENCSVVKGNHEINALTQNKFCAYLFAVGDGILVPANTNLGVVHYESSYFSFSKVEYAKYFTDEIEKFAKLYMDTLRSHPEAIVFFDVYEEVKNFGYDDDTTETTEVPLVKVDVDVQTELHPVPYNKDKNYCWNMWDLRRKAIQLTNIKNCRTHSSQTDCSYYRSSCRIQTVETNSSESQTKETTSANTEKFSKTNQIKNHVLNF